MDDDYPKLMPLEERERILKSALEPINKQFSTKDLYLAAAILATNLGTLDHTDRSDRRHMKFYFAGDYLALIAAELDWTNRKIGGNLSDYADAIRVMKSEVHRDDK